VFLFVPPAEVAGVTKHTNATPFDVDGSFWSDRGEKTAFDVMVEEFGLDVEPLLRLARIVRGGDRGKLDLTPQSAGLLATCLGYSRMYRDDLAQLAVAMPQFDALYRWSRDEQLERHRGREIDTAGDNFLASFDRALCAAAAPLPML
jgi:hypothetical protein